MKVRLLDLGEVSSLRSLSIFHGLTAAIQPDDAPIITLTRPKETFVSVGFSQEASKEVDLDYCEKNGIPVYRRHVGGGAVLLDSNQLFFHVILPSARAEEFGLPKKLMNKFAYLAQPPIQAYQDLGINAAFRPINDIHVDGKKIGGTGTGEINDGLVFAGSMMMDFNHGLMAKVLKIPDEKMRDKIHQTLEAYITTIDRELEVAPSVPDVAEALISAFETVYGIEVIPSAIQEREWDQIFHFDEKLIDDAWLHSVQLKEEEHKHVKIQANVKMLSAAHKAPGGMIRATVRVVDNHIDDLLISGDFAFSPTSALDDLAIKFQGASLDIDELKSLVETTLSGDEIDLAGVGSEDLTRIMEQITA